MIHHSKAAPVSVAIIAAVLMGAIGLAAVTPAEADGTPRPSNARLFIADLKNGDTVASPFKVAFGLEGMTVSPAGVAGVPNSGHHHLLIDTDLTPEELKQPIPADERHLHFGKGQTETSLTLPPGSHSLRLVLADHNHIPHDPPLLSDVVAVTVK